MRVMDGLMAIPGILLAIALMAVTRASLTTVIVAITVPRCRASSASCARSR
jgi:peptide/nickel transport system permease protein